MRILSTSEYFNGSLPKPHEGYDFRTIDEYFDLNGINEKECSDSLYEHIIQKYISSNWQWSDIIERPMIGHITYVEESLQTHPAKTLIGKIKKVFQNEIISCSFDNAFKTKNDVIRIELKPENNIADITCVGSSTLLANKTTQKFYKIIEQWLYYITIITYSSETIMIYLEPAYTKCLTEQIKENGCLLYHITKTENVDSIRKRGFRPKVGRTPKSAETVNMETMASNKKTKKRINGYRYFPERLFFIGCCKNKGNTIKNLEKAIQMKGLKSGEYAIMIVDFNGYDIDLWEDRAAPNIKYAVYTHTFIPNFMIKSIVYNPKDI